MGCSPYQRVLMRSLVQNCQRDASKLDLNSSLHIPRVKGFVTPDTIVLHHLVSEESTTIKSRSLDRNLNPFQHVSVYGMVVGPTLLLIEISGSLFTEFFPKETSLVHFTNYLPGSGIDPGTLRIPSNCSTIVPTKLFYILYICKFKPKCDINLYVHRKCVFIKKIVLKIIACLLLIFLNYILTS